MPWRIQCFLWMGAIGFISTISCAADGMDLLTRYPTSLSEETPDKQLTWTFTQEDLFSLSQFELVLGDTFRLKVGPSDVGIGHSDEGAVWAVVMPKEAGSLKSAVMETPEPVAHIWLRFHPQAIVDLFPPATLVGKGDADTYYRIRRIASGKFSSSWHAGPLALIPPLSAYTIDIDTTENKRRFFSADRSTQTVKYYPSFSQAISFQSITPTEAESSFDLLWNEYDQHYAIFGLRPKVDWNALREQYRPKALQSKTSYEFASICAEMLAHLRDLHIWVRMGEESLPVFQRPRPGNANPKAVEAILGGLKHSGKQVAWSITADRIGYIAIFSWSDPETPRQVDQILESMINTRGLIIDVRLNGGGSEPLGMQVAGRFLDREAIYSYSQYRNGPLHSDLTEKIPRTVSPCGPWRYDRPVVVLIGQLCLSSNESFIAMMDQCPQVTLMGDRTGGSSGNPKLVDLPVGVQVSLPRWLDLLADGTPLDEKGIQPDVVVETDEKSLSGNDPILKAALERMGKEPLADEPIVTPTPIPTPAVVTIQSSSAIAPSKPRKVRKTPHVVMLDPLFGATEVDPTMEMLVTFDIPMNPYRGKLHWITGGFRQVGAIELYEDIFQYVIPIELEPSSAHKVSVSPGGFKEKNGGGSAQIDWSFSTGPLESDEQAPIPNCIQIEPASGSTISRVGSIRLSFDVPMAPNSLSFRDESKSGASLCPLILYNEENYTLTIPILFPAHWQGEIRLSGMQSATGKRVDPISLTYRTDDACFDEEQTQEFEQNRKSKELQSLLKSMKSAREDLHSFEETVHRISSSMLQSSGYTHLQMESARFWVQGTTRFVADISDCMDFPFMIGSTGRRYWRYEEGITTASLRGLQPEEIQQVDLEIANPLKVMENDIHTVLADHHLDYRGIRELIDRNVHVICAWRILPGKEKERLSIDEWWIDTETFLPVRVQQTSSEGIQVTYHYRFNRINDEFSEADFAPGSITEIFLEMEEPLGEGYDRRFVRIKDGSSGEWQVEWGKSGAETSSSIGLN